MNSRKAFAPSQLTPLTNLRLELPVKGLVLLLTVVDNCPHCEPVLSMFGDIHDCCHI